MLLAAAIATAGITIQPPGFPRPSWEAPFEAMERVGYDALFLFRGPEPDRIDPRIVVVPFDENSEELLGHKWPIPRAIHAQVIRNLAKAGASVIAYDVLFSGPTDAKDDKALDKALKDVGNVVLTSRLEFSPSSKLVHMESPYYSDPLNIDFEGSASGTGPANIPQDVDNVIRTFNPAFEFQDEWVPSFASSAYLRLNSESNAKVRVTRDAVQVGSATVPRSGPTGFDPVHGYEIPSTFIDFSAGEASFGQPSPFYQVYLGEFPKDQFRGKIVFVGLTDDFILKSTAPAFDLQRRGTIDRYATAYTSLHAEVTPGAKDTQIPGVFIQAQYLNAMLRSQYVHEMAPKWLWFTLFSFSLFGLSAVRRYANWQAPVLFICSIVGFLTLAMVLFTRYSIHFPYVVPTVGMTAMAGVISFFERGSIKRRWSSYVSPGVLDHILRGDHDLGARRLNATVLFTDLRGFTGFSEGQAPEAVVSVLNQHFERITSAIDAEHGTLDKFVGDGLLAVFGAPVPMPRAAWHGVRGAWNMWVASQEEVEHQGRRFRLMMSVGISTGPIVAGHVGSKRRHDFTVIGDPVNSASRLQALGRSGGVHIDRATYEEVIRHVDVEPMGRVPIRGKAVPMECYRVLAWSDEPIYEPTGDLILSPA